MAKILWQARNSTGSPYTTMKTPSQFKIDWEDLDANSYRSVTTGNLIRTRVSSKWFKGGFTYNYLTESELETILAMINNYPLYVKIKSPLFGTSGMIECEAYVSKVSVSMERNKETGATWNNLTFNIIQSKAVNGQ